MTDCIIIIFCHQYSLKMDSTMATSVCDSLPDHEIGLPGETLLDEAHRLAFENAAVAGKRTTLKKANRDWNVGASDEEANEPTNRKISFCDSLSIVRICDDGTFEMVEKKNAFPFPVGTNPDVQTVSYGMDIEDKSALQNFDVAAVLKRNPTIIVAHFTGSGSEHEIETSFKIGFLIATPTYNKDTVCFIVLHANNEHISVINIDGTETHRGNLPVLRIGCIWCNARFQTDDVLTLQIYCPITKEYSTMECEVARI